MACFALRATRAMPFIAPRFALRALLLVSGVLLCSPATAQESEANWRRGRVRQASAEAPIVENTADVLGPMTPVARPRAAVAEVKHGAVDLPNEQGQIWREYDLTPYTARVTSTARPEQAIVDWILRETGYEAWHGEPLGILSANTRTLRVYHTPEMHAVVADVVDRFVSSEAQTHAFGLRVVTVDSPNWRARAQQILKPVACQTPGAQAWSLAKEDAAMLLGELRKRTDFREHSSPHLLVNNGQSTVVSVTRPRTYLKEIVAKPGSWPGFETVPGQIDEGFGLELTPLLAMDGKSIDAIVKCNVDQVEKLVPVTLEVPTPLSPRQRARIEVPRLSQARMHERFRFSGEDVLVIGLGVVAMPVPTEQDPLLGGLQSLAGPPRADLLIFVESKGRNGAPPSMTRAASADPRSYNGRY